MVEFLQLSLKHAAKHMMHACVSSKRSCMACQMKHLSQGLFQGHPGFAASVPARSQILFDFKCSPA